MAKIDFAHTFGQQPAGKNGRQSREDLPKAEFWLNIGYVSNVKDDEGNDKFISLPMGIPLDTQELLPTNSRNVDYAQMQAARNNLHEQIMKIAAQLQPGDETHLNLVVQLRRVNEEAPAVDPANNPYAVGLNLA